MKKIILVLTFISCFVSSFAYSILYGNNIVISQPVYENLYIAGGTITINAPIHGDLTIAGGNITINDTVTNDILVAGGQVYFNGFAGGNIRCAGGSLRVGKNVAGDVVAAAGNIIIERYATIGGLLVSGGDIKLEGNVDGKVTGAFGTLTINGNITKDIDCRGGKITLNGNIYGKSVIAARNIEIGNNATFNNDVRYWNKNGSLDFKQSLKNGTAVYDSSIRIDTGEWYYLGAATIMGLLWYLGMAFLLIIILQYLFSSTMRKAADTVFNDTLKSVGYGFLYFIVVPIAAVIAFFTVVGIPVGILLIFSYIGILLLATVITSTVAANCFNNLYHKNWHFWQINFAALGIFILLKLIQSTHFMGWLIILFIVCIAFGSILLNINWKGKKRVMQPNPIG